jgi:transcription elongation GreA/GreB family factor
MEKFKLIAAWKAHLELGLKRARTSQKEARQGMRVDGSNRPANRGERATVTSQGYLTQGLTQRTAALEEALVRLERVGADPRNQVVMGALVLAEHENGVVLRFALLPGGDATLFSVDGASAVVLSLQAPLVQPFLGLRTGDAAELNLPGRQGEWAVLCID